ncbi:MAG: hypothetical protein DMF61_06385 [Blastocatellia bacterium AA13]|nr:MAG: hypothetical protein DMF61_06385 [Blastocatellia bacterium AA13]
MAEHYNKSPDLITEEELRQYFLYTKNAKKYARPTTTIALCGIKFFFEKTLGTRWTIFDLIRPGSQKKRRPQPRPHEGMVIELGSLNSKPIALRTEGLQRLHSSLGRRKFLDTGFVLDVVFGVLFGVFVLDVVFVPEGHLGNSPPVHWWVAVPHCSGSAEGTADCYLQNCDLNGLCEFQFSQELS